MRTPLALLTEDACSDKCFQVQTSSEMSWMKQEESVLMFLSSIFMGHLQH